MIKIGTAKGMYGTILYMKKLMHTHLYFANIFEVRFA